MERYVRSLMRHFSVIASTAAVVLVVTGCTGSEDPAKSASGSPTAAPTLGKVSLPRDPSALADLIAKQIRRMPSVKMTATTKLGKTEGGTISASLGRSGKTPAASLRFEEEPSGTLEVVQGMMIGSTFYMRDLNNNAAPGKPWLRLSTGDLKDPRLGQTSKVFQTAVSQIAGAIKQATGESDMANIRPGKLTADPADDTLNGRKVRRYQGATQLAKLSGAGQDDQDQKVLSVLSKAGVKSFPWKLWVDESGLPHKFSVSMRIAQRGTFSAQSTYTDWGAPVEVKAPPAKQVTGLGDATGD